MQYTVIIKKHHCIKADFDQPFDCPLFRAIKEQLPTVPVVYIGGYYVAMREVPNIVMWPFKKELSKGWREDTMIEILEDKIKEYPVTFKSPDHDGDFLCKHSPFIF